MTTRYRRSTCLWITLAAVLLAPNLAVAAQEDEMPVIRWGVFKNYQPVYIAQELGYFEEEGVRVEFTETFTSGPAVVQAAASESVDAGHSALSGIINAVAAGVPIIGVADSQTEFLDAPLMQWLVLEESTIATATDLRGKTIAVNSLSGSFYYTALLYLEQNGLSADDVTFVVMPHHTQEQVLREGQIDVAGLIDPYSVSALQGGGIRTLFRGVDVIGEVQFSQIFVRTELIENNREAVKSFVDAYIRAVEFIASKPDEAAAIMAEFIGIDADLNTVHRYTPNAAVKLDDVRFWLDMMRQSGELEDDGKLQPINICDPSFTGAANG